MQFKPTISIMRSFASIINELLRVTLFLKNLNLDNILDSTSYKKITSSERDKLASLPSSSGLISAVLGGVTGFSFTSYGLNDHWQSEYQMITNNLFISSGTLDKTLILPPCVTGAHLFIVIDTGVSFVLKPFLGDNLGAGTDISTNVSNITILKYFGLTSDYWLYYS